MLDEASALAGQTVAEANIRTRTEASVIANPKSATVLQVGDIVGLIGEAEPVAEARRLLAPATRPAANGSEQLAEAPANLVTVVDTTQTLDVE